MFEGARISTRVDNTGDAFYQKRVPKNAPPWVPTAHITFPSGRTADEIAPDSVAVVAWCANLGTLTFHPWPVDKADVESPNQIRIDLDPQPGTDFSDAAWVAPHVRELLAEFGMQGWPKTSGGRGVHIYVPIQPRWTFTEVRHAVIAFGRELERRLPDRVTMAWWKEERGEKIFIDYNQMARDRTIASAYSIRPKPHAPVSAPLDWDELPDVTPVRLRRPDHAGPVPGGRRQARRPGRPRLRHRAAARALRAAGEGRRPRRPALSAGVPEDAGRADAGPAQPREEAARRADLPLRRRTSAATGEQVVRGERGRRGRADELGQRRCGVGRLRRGTPYASWSARTAVEVGVVQVVDVAQEHRGGPPPLDEVHAPRGGRVGTATLDEGAGGATVVSMTVSPGSVGRRVLPARTTLRARPQGPSTQPQEIRKTAGAGAPGPPVTVRSGRQDPATRRFRQYSPSGSPALDTYH